MDFSKTLEAQRNSSLIDSLELEPDFAVRRGVLDQRGWKLGSAAQKKLKRAETPTLEARDLVPDISQKGVDIKIGLDIASLSLRRIAGVLVLVTGDSDFVPPMKFARREGLRVFLAALGHGVKRELKAHADRLLEL